MNPAMPAPALSAEHTSKRGFHTGSAISRTTPALMGLYSLIVLWAEDLLRRGALPYAAAWYRKNVFTFTDAIAAVRRHIWIGDISDISPHDRDMPKIPARPPHAHGRRTLLRSVARKVSSEPAQKRARRWASTPASGSGAGGIHRSAECGRMAL
jgi:hypothetical protein